jgi:hypothetical protein
MENGDSEVVELLRLWMADWARAGLHVSSPESKHAQLVALNVLHRGRSVDEAFHAGRDALLPLEHQPLDLSAAVG